MTDAMEFYASTVDEAVEKAALELGLASAEVSYRVLDEGNSGFLGIGARDARIIVEAPARHSAGEDELTETTPQRAWWLTSLSRNAPKVPEMRGLPPFPRSTGNSLSPNRSRHPRSCWRRSRPSFLRF